MPNRLADATSPYLLQHADNPVDWHPWGEEALALARREDRPILLSIGYSACHWCHVMAHESFEDSATAAVMNRHFVNIKVDREERPDLDHIYQLAHQLLQQRAGGWPLTVFLTPDGMPFFSGTYFPRRPRYGLPGFVELLEHVTGVFANRRPEIEQQNASMRAALMPPRDAPAAAPCLDEAPVAHASALLARSFDREWGGFGGAPKFPHAPDLALLLRDEDPAHRLRAIDTLRHMAVGGIYDQLGGGFCRYSVDERWEIPHFEKMLYDNALLLPLYADAWAMTGETRFREVVEQTAAWVMREMQSPAGGYYSSLDADAEGEEGRFYVWTPDQASAALSPAEYAVFAPRYGLDRPPNFEGHAWHLRIVRSPESIAKSVGLSVATVESLLASACARLLQVREERVRPGRDDKVLAAWNALMIEGMAHAAKILDHRDWLASAERALQDLCDTLWCDGRLLATAKDGHAHLNAYLDDHAFLLAALIELLQARYRHQDVELARQVADTLLLRFEDRDAGGFHFTSHDHEILIARPKHAHDNALPSGNGVAARALAHLAAITGEMRYADAARRVLECFWPELSVAPAGSTALLQALREFCVPPQVVVLRGPAAQLPDWQKYVSCRFPALLLFAVPNGEDEVPAGLAKSEAPTVNAWVCSGVNCLQPVAQVESLAALLGGQM